jgi:uncharacterized protein (TIGR00255 family)
MIHSMTAFARREQRLDAGTLCWELRSVNHRYLEVSPRLPDEFRPLETEVRKRASHALRRGKVECQLRFQPASAGAAEIEIDRELARRIGDACRELAGLLEAPAPVTPLDLLRWPGVLVSHEPDIKPLQQAALALFDAALGELRDTRSREGEQLAATLRERCTTMAAIVAEVGERLPGILEHQRQRLRARLEELATEINPERLEQELVFLANKLDVEEELDRLRVHLQEVIEVLDRDEAVGRRLDFLMQELHREANTLGSKSADVETTRASVDLKVLIEQMREQVQNIE